MDEIATAKLEMVGLTPEDGDKFPSELSGGMTKRVALARALALDPAIVFLDEPTSGLDPIAAGDFDALIRTLQQTLGLTVFMVTHDLASLQHRLRPRRGAGRRQDRRDRPDARAASIRASLGAGLFSRQALPDAATQSELRRWKPALPSSSSAPSCWRPSSPCSASSTGCTTPAGSVRARLTTCSSRARCRGCWSAPAVLFNGIRVGEVTELGLAPGQSAPRQCDDLGGLDDAGARRHQGRPGIPGPDRRAGDCAGRRHAGGAAPARCRR